MTVSSTLVRQRYTGTGATTTFSCGFRVLDATHLVVSRIASGVVTTLVYGTDYTVTGVGAVSAASVVLTTALAAGVDVLIQRVVPLLQPTDIRNQGAFYASIHEDAFDRIVMQTQQVANDVTRSLQLSATSEDGSGTYDAGGNRIGGAGDALLSTDLVTLQQLVAAGGGATGAVADTFASASFGSGGALNINVLAPSSATTIRAAVSTVSQPVAATVDAATGTLLASASQARLTSTGPYTVGQTVYISVRSYIAGVGGRLVTLVINRDADTGATVATGPSLTMSGSFTPTTFVLTYTAIGTLTQSTDGGAFVAASSSPITLTRNAPGGATRSVDFLCALAGQTIPNGFTIPPQNTTDTDTVTPDLTVTDTAPTNGGTAALHQQWTVTASNPKTGGAAPTIAVSYDAAYLTVQSWTGAAWAALATGSTVASGTLVRALRPQFGVYPQVVTFVASLGAGNGTERISRTVLNQDAPIRPRVLITQVASTNASKTLRIATVSGGATVRWTGGSAGLLSGPAVNTYNAEPQDYTFARPAQGAGDTSAQFEALVAGVADADFETISTVDRDTYGILVRAQTIAETSSTQTVRVTASTKYADAAGAVVLTAIGGAVVVVGGSGALPAGDSRSITISTADGLATAGYAIDYVITKPAIGGLPARVIWRVQDAAGVLVADGDAVDVQPQVALTPGRIELVALTESSADITVRWRAYNASGVQSVVTGDVAVRTYATISGAAEGAAVDPGVSYDGGTTSFTSTVTRVAGTQYRVQLTYNPGTGGTAQVTRDVVLPVYGVTGSVTGPRFGTITVNVPVGAPNQITLNFTGINAPSGATYALQYKQDSAQSAADPIVSGSTVIALGRSVSGGGFIVSYTMTGVLSMLDSSRNVVAQKTLTPTAYFGA